ncbi:MAG TPA: hypothetical protein VGQ93_09705 [Lysobacter sp.]|nr:hypothetical protein [Lysobacter sp.]
MEGSDEHCKTIQRISNLRALSFYVLLGEPGIGKTHLQRPHSIP